MARPSIDPAAPLRVLLSERKSHLGLNSAQLAKKAGLSVAVVNDALGPNVARAISHRTIVALARALDLDVAHVVLCWVVHTYPELAQDLRPILVANSPYRAGSLRSLSLRWLLSVGGTTPRKLSRRVAPKGSPKGLPIDVYNALEKYLREPSSNNPSVSTINRWLAGLSEANIDAVKGQFVKQGSSLRCRGSKLCSDDLDAVPALLAVAHNTEHTWSSILLSKTKTIRDGHIELPQGCAVFASHSRTIFGAVYLEKFEVRSAPRTGGPVGHYGRITAKPHPYWEIGLVLRGSVRFTVQDANNVVRFDETISAGGVVCFASRNQHIVEFLSHDAMVMSINIRRNIVIARHLDP